jgi:hypothetical protein
MPELVYIREIHEPSFLLFTTANEGFRLRDFSSPGDGPFTEIAQQAAGRTASDIRALTRNAGNYRTNIAEKPLSDYAYWHKKTLELNKKYLAREGKSWVPPGLWEKLIYPVLAAVIIAVVLGWLKLSK